MSQYKINQMYEKLDSLVDSLLGFLNCHRSSEQLQVYATSLLRSFFFANLLGWVFENMTSANVKELGLPTGYIGKIKASFRSTIKGARDTCFNRGQEFGEREYEGFKVELEEKYPDFLKLVNEIEEVVDLKKARNFLDKAEVKFGQSGSESDSLTILFTTEILAAFVQKERRLPNSREIEKYMRQTLTPAIFKEMALPIVDSLDESVEEMLSEDASYRVGFENRLYEEWREPLDALEATIVIAEEAGERKATALAESPDYKDSSKLFALVQIHARSIQIAKEILTLLKAGFADGANSRWRTIYELTVVAYFLKSQPEDLSQRFLAHDVMKRYKEAGEYRRAYKKLGYPPIDRREFNKLKKERDALIKIYGSGFKYRSGYEWIPPTVIWRSASSPRARVNFRDVEDKVKLGHWHGFYMKSSNAVHPGSSGFYRLGMIRQEEMLLTGSSNYGLADPLQNTGISLTQITVALLTLEPDIEDLLNTEVLQIYSERAGETAVSVQEGIEKRDLDLISEDATFDNCS